MNNPPLASYSRFLLDNLTERLETVSMYRTMRTIKKLETAVQVCTAAITDLYKLIPADNFNDLASEIEFFKVIKPQFTSAREYCQRLYHFELFGKENESYRSQELLRMDKLLQDHRSFADYYHSGHTENDGAWFSQGQQPLPTMLSMWPAETNPRFMSARDSWVAGLIAVERYRGWLLLESQTDGLMGIAKKQN